MKAVEAEREAARYLPLVLAELFDIDPRDISSWRLNDSGADLQAELAGRDWIFEVKATSSPGVVLTAARQLEKRARESGAIAVLVVPYMTPAGVKAADTESTNWIDLSGNASLRDNDLRIWVQGHPNRFAGRGRPASPFAPKSSRVARTMLLDPTRWWRQTDLASATDLDPGRVSRVVRRLSDGSLLESQGSRLRPRNPDALLDAWADDYKFDRHDIITGHHSGNGLELARELHWKLDGAAIEHALTGLPSAWLRNEFAQFRIVSIYVEGDPRVAAETVRLRQNERGANVQLIGPNDRGVFSGSHTVGDLPCVSAVQTYLDLTQLPERASEAAARMRENGGLWSA